MPNSTHRGQRGPGRKPWRTGRFVGPAALWRDAAGSVLIEYAIIGPIFFALLFAIFNVALIYLTQSSLESAAEEGARLIMVGEAQNWGYAPSCTYNSDPTMNPTNCAQNGMIGPPFPHGTAAPTMGYTPYNPTGVLPNGAGMTGTDFWNAICGQITSSYITSQMSNQDPNNTPTYTTSMLLPYMSCSNLYVNVMDLGSATGTNNNYGSSLAMPTITPGQNVVGYTIAPANGNSTGEIIAVQVVYFWPTVVLPFGSGQGWMDFSSKQGDNRRELIATSVLTTENYKAPTT